MDAKTACKMTRALDGVTEKEHFGSDAFYANKRIFATVWHERQTVNLRLSPTQQQHYLGEGGDAFSEIANAWGQQGWTTAHLEFIEKEMFAEALKAAWENSATKATKTVKKAKTAKSAKAAKTTAKRKR